MSAPIPRRLAAASVALALVLAVVACGDDDGASVTTTTAPEPTDAAPSTEGGGGSIEITAVDYAFEGVPESIAAGTELTLVNQADGELHEVLAVRLPDDETRTAEELAADPAALGPLLGSGPPAAVVVASPGSDQPGAVVGDGTLSEPGRYLLVCTIPTGADPDAYLAAAQESDGPPDVEGGPPHFTQGMVAEVLVE